MAVTSGINDDVQGMDDNTPATGFAISGRTTQGGNALDGNLEGAVITIGFVGGGDL